jgi:hypothetical protein
MGFEKISNGIRERVYKLCKIVNPIRVKVNDEDLPCFGGVTIMINMSSFTLGIPCG